MLIPNNKQKTKLIQCFGVSRFAYNWTLGKQQENYKNGGKFISDNELRKEFTKLKKTKEYEWLNQYSNNIPKQAIKDACDSYKRFFKGYSKFPRFKSKKKSRPSFYVDNIKIKFSDTHVKLEKLSNSTKKNKAKLNWVRLAEKNRIPTDCKYINPRVTFDGVNFWISVGIEYENNLELPTNEGIGIDLGIKDLAICSDKNIYKNINKTSKVKKIEKKRRRLQRQISRKYELNKQGDKFVKTNNILKEEKKIQKKRIKQENIKQDYFHKNSTMLVKTKPQCIVLEDLNIKGLMKNKFLFLFILS